jgi:parvulin-like peptidyl-prolyl isomerase
MRHVLSANIIQPTAAELVDFYNENASRYEIPAALNLEELVFNSSEPLQQALLSALQNGAEAETLLAMAEGTLSALPNVNSVDLANIFDPEFARQLVAAELGNWRGPFISNRGQHWLRVLERNSARTPPLYTIADRVRLDWISAEEDARLQQEIDKLLNQYTIIINNSAEE